MRTLVLGLATLLLLAPLSLGQTPSQAPPVTFGDATVPERIIPLAQPGTVEIPIEIGCDPLETPETTTIATLEIANTSPGVEPFVTPTELEWTTSPGACTTDPGGMPHTHAVSVSIGLDRTVPAFSNVTLPIEMTITKTPPTEEPSRTYGPYEANVSAEAGYFGLYNARAEEKIQETTPGKAAQFGLGIENLANGQTRFTLGPEQADSVNLTIEPDTLTLDSQDHANITIHARPTGTPSSGAQLPFTIRIASESAQHPGTGQPAQPSTLAYLLEVNPNTSTGASRIDAIPTPATPLATIALLAAGLLLAGAGAHPRER